MQLLKSKVFLGTVIMTAFSLLVRVLGFVFRIYLSNRIGAEGMGQYQLVNSVYMLAATVVTSGIGAAVTRLTAELVSSGRDEKGAVKTSLHVCGILGIGVGILLFAGAPLWTKLFLYDRHLVSAVRILAPCMPAIALCSCFCGYFYGVRHVLPAAFTQFLEQAVRIAVLVIGFEFLGNTSTSSGVTIAVLSVSLGEILSCFYIAFRYHFYGVKTPQKGISYFALLSVSTPIAANGYLNAILRMVENVLIPKLLMQFGMDLSGSLSLFGLLKGMVMPVLQLPSALISALSMNLMPSLAAAQTRQNHRRIRLALEKSVGIALIGGILMVGILVTFPYALGETLYHSKEAGHLLERMAFICPLIYLEIVLVGALNSLGLQRVAFRNSLVDSLVKLFVLCVGIPRYGFLAYLAAISASCVVCVAMNLTALLKKVSLVLDVKRMVLFPVVSMVIARVVILEIKKAAWGFPMPLVLEIALFCGVYAAGLWLLLKQHFG